jgi:hypothetical protein
MPLVLYFLPFEIIVTIDFLCYVKIIKSLKKYKWYYSNKIDLYFHKVVAYYFLIPITLNFLNEKNMTMIIMYFIHHQYSYHVDYQKHINISLISIYESLQN